MSAFVLVIVFWSYSGMAASTIDMPNKEACVKAQNDLKGAQGVKMTLCIQRKP